MSATLVITLLLATYMLQQVKLKKTELQRRAHFQVSQLYQQYQKASRLEGYLGDLEGVRIDSILIAQHLELLRRYKFSPPCSR